MHDQAFIGRQPILNAKQHIIGYELFFRHSAEANDAVLENDLKASARVLVNTLNDMGAQWLLGDKLAFINVNEEMLHSEFLELLPPERTVLEILKNVVPSDTVIARCKDLRTQGFHLALDGCELAESTALLALASYLKVDTLALGLARAAVIFNQYHTPNLKLVAEKVETRTQQEALQKLGFQYFQGFYFAHPETLSARIINPAYSAVLNLLNLVSRDAENHEIETGFKLDAALSYKLLRYINSIGFGLSCEIQSINHALSILGRKQLYRWLTLLMVTAGKNAATSALMKTSITRGRFTELLGESYFDKQGKDNLFIVGIFSLLDSILEMPMELVLEKMQLPETISEALLNREGIYGPFLQLAEACEEANTPRVVNLAESLQLDPSQVNDHHIAALAWVETLGI
ncbi:MAG: EAL domain-containing protein [Methylophilaceae bacterium]